MSKNNEEIMVSTPNVLFSDPKFFEFCANVSMMDVDVDTEALTAEFEEEFVKSRVGDYGKVLNYVPSKFIRQRLNEVLGCKWSFIPVVEQRVSDPLPKYDKNEDEYVDSDSYIKILGLLIIPGLGVQAQYGVKKTYGYGEANDWKAATTDAFKKCCAAFGIEADYDIDDDVDDDGKPVEKIDLDELEYDDDELEEALETEVTFGKYKELTLEEIYEEDESYIEWLIDNARDQELREASAIVYKHFSEEEDSKKKKGKGKGKDDKKSNKKSSKEKAGKSKEKEKESKKKSNKKKSSEDDEKRQELIDSIQEIFDEDEEYYDEVTITSLIQSVSISKKNPDGKESLEDLNVKELEALAETLMEDDDEDEA